MKEPDLYKLKRVRVKSSLVSETGVVLLLYDSIVPNLLVEGWKESTESIKNE